MPLHKGQMPAPQRVQWQLHVSALKCKPSANCVCAVPLNWWAGLFSMRLLFASHGLIPSCSAGDVRTIPGVGCWWRRQRRCRPVWRCSPSRDQRHFVGSRGPLPPPSSASLLHRLLRQTFKAIFISIEKPPHSFLNGRYTQVRRWRERPNFCGLSIGLLFLTAEESSLTVTLVPTSSSLSITTFYITFG